MPPPLFRHCRCCPRPQQRSCRTRQRFRFLWDEQKDFPDGPGRLAANLRRIGLSRILFATDWPDVNASDYVLMLRSNLRLTPVEIDQIFSNLAPYFP